MSRTTPLRRPHHNLLAVWPSMFALSMGLMAVVPTLGLYLEDRFGLHGDELRGYTGWAYAAAPLTAAVLGPLWGSLGDRIGRRPMVVRAALAIGAATALMPLAPTPWALVALRVVQGAFAGFIAPAMALGTADVPSEHQGRAIGRLQLALALGLLTGPAIGAELAQVVGLGGVFYFTAAASFLSAVPVLWFAREGPRDAAAPRAGLLRGLRNDLGRLLGSPTFVALLLCIFLMRFGQQMVEPYVALFIPRLGALSLVAGDPEHAIGRTVALAFTVLAVAQLLFSTSWGRLADRIGPLRCLAAVALGLAVVFFCTTQVTGIEGFMGLRCAAAVFMAGNLTLAYTAVARRVDPAAKSLAFSLVQSTIQYGLALGPIAGGALADEMPGFYLLGGICLAVAGAGMLVVRVFSRGEAAVTGRAPDSAV